MVSVVNYQMASANARAAAIRRLQESHWDEWEQIYAEERERNGLPASRSPKVLEEENRSLRQRIAELERAR